VLIVIALRISGVETDPEALARINCSRNLHPPTFSYTSQR